MALLEIRDLCVDYLMQEGSVHAVDHVSLTLEEGSSLGLVGESGSGKSTLGMAILRLLPEKTARVTGSAVFQGEELLTMPESRLRQVRWQELAAVFQKSMNALSPVHRIGSQMADVYRLPTEDFELPWEQTRPPAAPGCWRYCARWIWPSGCTSCIPMNCPAA